VRAAPDAVALLLIALLVTGSLSETEDHTKILAKLKSETKRCPLTGETTFGSALAAVLASADMAERVRGIEVVRGRARTGAGATIFFTETLEKKGLKASRFGGVELARHCYGLHVRASLGVPLGVIAHALKEAKK
jgi:hypothetical protein